MATNKIYFPNLNGIRFIAAFLVIIHHTEQLKSIFKLPSYWAGDAFITKFIRIIGGQGVILFFVLSGFLITYLLMAEEAKTKTISIKKFYIRRTLRIWPLYFLIVCLSLFVFVEIEILQWPGYGKEVVQSYLPWKVGFYLFFFSNLVLSFFGVIPYASQTWSIGTEEQFYLVWPIVLKFFRKYRLGLMVGIVVFYNFILYFLASKYSDLVPNKFAFIAFWSGFKIDTMAIGGFFAVLLFKSHPKKLLLFIKNYFVFYIAISTIVISYFFGIQYPIMNNVVYSILYGIIILNFGANSKIHISLENKFFNSLGNISYGLYMIHPIGITLAIKLAIKLEFISNRMILPLALTITIILSYISYYMFESYFLSLKSKFTVVQSGGRN